jgi:hypothetical protein
MCIYHLFHACYIPRRPLAVCLHQESHFALLPCLLSLGPTQHPVQWVPRALAPRVKRPGHEADRSPPSSAEVKNAWSYTCTTTCAFMAWCLVKHRILVHSLVLSWAQGLHLFLPFVHRLTFCSSCVSLEVTAIWVLVGRLGKWQRLNWTPLAGGNGPIHDEFAAQCGMRRSLPRYRPRASQPPGSELRM